MNSTRILYVEMAPGLGGSGRSLLDLVPLLSDATAFIVAPFDLEAASGTARGPHPTFLTLPSLAPASAAARSRYWEELSRLWRSTRDLCTLIRRHEIALVHANNGISYNLAAMLAARICRVPVVVHQRGWEQQTKIARLARRMARDLRVIAISRAVAADLEAHGVRRERIHHLYDVVRFPPAEPPRHREPSRRVTVGMHGMLVPWKGHMVLLEAAALAAQRVPGRFCLRIAGGTPTNDDAYLAHLRDTVHRLGLDSLVQFVGHQHDIYDFLSGIDISVHASIEPEPLGRVIIEAQLAGVAVIATAAGGAQELVAEGTTGHLVPMGDPLTLADMLVRLIDDPDGRTRIALAGQAWAREQFDSARLAAGVDDIHRSAMQAYR